MRKLIYLIIFLLWQTFFNLFRFLLLKKKKTQVSFYRECAKNLVFVKSILFRYKEYLSKTDIYFFERAYKAFFKDVMDYFKKKK